MIDTRPKISQFRCGGCGRHYKLNCAVRAPFDRLCKNCVEGDAERAEYAMSYREIDWEEKDVQ